MSPCPSADWPGFPFGTHRVLFSGLIFLPFSFGGAQGFVVHVTALVVCMHLAVFVTFLQVPSWRTGVRHPAALDGCDGRGAWGHHAHLRQPRVRVWRAVHARVYGQPRGVLCCRLHSANHKYEHDGVGMGGGGGRVGGHLREA